MKIKIILITSILLTVQTILASPRITQVDNSNFTLDTKITIYVNGDGNKALNKENFKIFEKVKVSSGDNWIERKIINFNKPENLSGGIHFLLMLDMSGSMTGRKIASAKKALVEFIRSTSTEDKIMIMAFGRTVVSSGSFTNNKEELLSFVANMGEPAHNAPTPLYYAVTLSSNELAKINGRKAVILLSDGVDDLRSDGYNDLTGFGNNLPNTSLVDAINNVKKTGVPVYSIGYECSTPALAQISGMSGGEYFPEAQAAHLSDLYRRIRIAILAEYMLTFNTDIGGYDIRNIFVQMNSMKSNEREYYAGSIFGQQHPLSLILLAVFLLAILILVILYFIRFTSVNKNSFISVLKGKSSTKRMNLNEKPVIIGRNEKNDIGIFGDMGIDANHLKIYKSNGRYLAENLSKNKALFVNNKAIQKEALKDGSVIQIGSSILLFNEKEFSENMK